ncbi:MAG: hydrogenase maturation protease [Thermoplasmata archaeon]|nr:hydrogenase maturation protease [Thermoplasmata archaeon]MCI4361779.1 hydrogenase maturation protease [Thermoplasmata archaeon]
MPEPESPRAPPPTERTLVVGIGNEHRGDDAAGLLVVRRVRPLLGGVGRVVEATGAGTELIDLWEGRELVVAVDAVRSGGAPGSVVRREVGPHPLPTPLSATSSHGFSLGQAVALGQALDRLPGTLILYGIEAAQFDPGSPPSAAVAAAIEPVAQQVASEVRRYLGLHGPTFPEVLADA